MLGWLRFFLYLIPKLSNSPYHGYGSDSSNRRRVMDASYTAIVQQSGKWWIGWVEEVPGVNSQASTRDELLANLREVLAEALEMNREDARAAAAAAGSYEEVRLMS